MTKKSQVFPDINQIAEGTSLALGALRQQI